VDGWLFSKKLTRLQVINHWMATSGKVLQVAIHLARIPANKAMLFDFGRTASHPSNVSGEADTGHALFIPFL
jgi:hypothetical protein